MFVAKKVKTDGAQVHRRSSWLTPRTVIAVVLVVLAALFILQNRNSTSIHLFWMSVQAPLWLVLVVIFAVGWVAGFLFARGR